MDFDDFIIELSENWRNSGVHEGDTVLIHSNIKRTLKNARKKGYRVTPQHILDSFIKAVGNTGTVILPLFNFDFPNTKIFDINNTPSQMGVLTEAARLYPDAVRTGHPIYSFAVIGKNSNAFKDVDNESGYGEDSPFAILRELNGKIASLDLDDQSSMTFYHHVEEMMKVNYRYFKEFSGSYTDNNADENNKKYKLFVRDIDNNVLTDVNPAGELMWEAGLYQGDRPKHDTGLRTINANEMYNFVSEIIEKKQALGTLYSIGENK